MPEYLNEKVHMLLHSNSLSPRSNLRPALSNLGSRSPHLARERVKLLPLRRTYSVSILTKFMLLCFLASIAFGCSNLRPPAAATAASYEMECKNRAYLRLVLEDYLNTRFHSGSAVRLAILPTSVPANLSAFRNDHKSVGDDLAWRLRNALVAREAAPIVEVLNRYDWPGKKDEFFVGNHQAIATAREAGYDLVLVSYLEPMHSFDEMVLFSKLMETESGITVWNGKSSVSREESLLDQTKQWLELQRRVPVANRFEPMLEEVIACAVDGILSDEPT
jgi:hypothetical protein